MSEQESGLGTEAVPKHLEECCLLACSPCLTQIPVLQNLGPHAQGQHVPQSARSSYINFCSRKCRTDMSKGQCDRSNSLSEGPYAQVSSVCIKLAKTNKHIHSYKQISTLNTHTYVYICHFWLKIKYILKSQ